jgi:hypothetical protein
MIGISRSVGDENCENNKNQKLHFVKLFLFFETTKSTMKVQQFCFNQSILGKREHPVS